MIGRGILTNQNGGASLLAVAITGAMIAILTVSLSRLMTGELRHSSDLESGIKSYYTAESGADLATLYIKNYMRNPATELVGLNQGCQPGDGESTGLTGSDPFLSPQAFGLANVTCLSVRAVNFTSPTDLSKNQTLELDLTGLNYSHIDVYWGKKTTGNQPSDSERTTDPKIEASLINFNINADNPTTTGIGVAMLDPSRNCAGASEVPCAARAMFYTLYPLAADATEPTPDTLTFGVQRLGSENRASFGLPNTTKIAHITAADIGLDQPYNSVLRLTAREKDARVFVRVFNGTTELTAIPMQDAVADITARVGSAFRRLEVTVPVKSSPLDSANVLYSDGSLCKDQDVLSIPGGVGGGAYEQAFQNICEIQ